MIRLIQAPAAMLALLLGFSCTVLPLQAAVRDEIFDIVEGVEIILGCDPGVLRAQRTQG